jgi:hypothetical protein
VPHQTPCSGIGKLAVSYKNAAMSRTLSFLFLAFILMSLSCSKKNSGTSTLPVSGNWMETQYWVNPGGNAPSEFHPVEPGVYFVRFEMKNRFSSNIDAYKSFDEYSIKGDKIYLGIAGTYMVPIPVTYKIVDGKLRLMRNNCNGCGEIFTPSGEYN